MTESPEPAGAERGLVVVGAGQAAAQLVSSLRSLGYEGRIRLFGEEPALPYQRPPLSKQFLSGELAAEQLALLQPAFYQDNRIEVATGSRVATIDRAARTIGLASGETLGYDKLALTTGALVRHLPVPGADLDGILTLRTSADVERIRARMAPGRRLVIVGGGYIGLEVAAVAVKQGLSVTVLEMADRVMNRVVCPEVSAFYQSEHEAAGVTLLTKARVGGFEPGDGAAVRVNCADGQAFEADLVLVGVGVRPNTALAEAAGLEVDDGILVDEFARTSDPDIVAAGDCTRHVNLAYDGRLRLESVQNAVSQGRIAAATLVGAPQAYDEVPWFWSDQYDLKLQIVGLSDGCDRTVIRGEPGQRSFAVYYLRGGIPIAVDAVNAPRDFMMGKKLIAAGGPVDPARLADPAVPLREIA